MTKQTQTLINEFSKTGAAHLIPGIIIGMQEEDDVAGTVSFKNCFKILRNIAAHEPQRITSQIFNLSNCGNQKIVLTSIDSNQNELIVDVVQMTAWLCDMYVKTRNDYYMQFLLTFNQTLQPNTMRLFSCQAKPFVAEVCSDSDKTKWAVKNFLKLQDVLYEDFGLPKTINVYDSYMSSLLADNPRLFWKVAIPNMMQFVIFLFSRFDAFYISNIELFLEIFRTREVCDKC